MPASLLAPDGALDQIHLPRHAWPQVRITVRGGSGFSNDELMAWCEEEGIDYLLGLAKNDRLKRRIKTQMEVVYYSITKLAQTDQ